MPRWTEKWCAWQVYFLTETMKGVHTRLSTEQHKTPYCGCTVFPSIWVNWQTWGLHAFRLSSLRKKECVHRWMGELVPVHCLDNISSCQTLAATNVFCLWLSVCVECERSLTPCCWRYLFKLTILNNQSHVVRNNCLKSWFWLSDPIWTDMFAEYMWTRVTVKTLQQARTTNAGDMRQVWHSLSFLGKKRMEKEASIYPNLLKNFPTHWIHFQCF